MLRNGQHTLLKPGVIFDENELPSVIHPAGLSLQRQWYKIREFCPLPSHPRPFSRQKTEHPPTSNVKSVPLPLHHRPRCHLLHLHLRGSVYAEFAGQWDMTRGTVPRIELSQLSQPFKPFFFSSSKNCQQTKEFAVYNRRGAYMCVHLIASPTTLLKGCVKLNTRSLILMRHQANLPLHDEHDGFR